MPFAWTRLFPWLAFIALVSFSSSGWGQTRVVLNNPAGNYDLANPLSWEPNYTPPGQTSSGEILLVLDPSGTQYQREFTMSSDWSIGTLQMTGFLSFDRSIDLLGNQLTTKFIAESWPTLELRNGSFKGILSKLISLKNIQFEGGIGVGFNSTLEYDQLNGTINTTIFNGSPVFGSGTHISVASIGGNQASVRRPNGTMDVRDGGTIQTDQTIAEIIEVHSGAQFTSTETQVRTVRASGAGTVADLGTFERFGSIYFRGPTSVRVTDGAEVRFGLDFVGTAFDVSGPGSKLIVEPTGGTRFWDFRRSDVTNGGEVDFGGEFSLGTSSTLRVEDGKVHGDFTILGGGLDLKNAQLVGSMITINEGRLLGSGHFTGGIASDLFAIFRAVILPEGTLSFGGDFASFAPIEFDFRSVYDFDRIDIGGQMLTFPSMKIFFSNGFRGSVGDELEFIHAEDGLATTGIPLGAISLLNLPTGYVFLTQADANSISLRITAVPEVSSGLLAIIGVMGWAGLACRRRSA